jgi:hypothetical protein
MVLPTLDLDMDRFLKRLIAGNPAPPEPTLGAIAQMREAASDCGCHGPTASRKGLSEAK